MRILIVTPPRSNHLSGNQVTAQRWQRILRGLKHRVEMCSAYRGQSCDVLIALHVRHSHSSVRRFRHQHPDKPLIVVLTDTDLYRDIATSKSASLSLRLASRILLLQLEGLAELSKDLAHKARVIYQSAVPPSRPARPLKRVFEVTVIGQLRAEEDPLRAALAARRLPASSRTRIVHLGKAQNGAWQRRAEQEMERNRRYVWLGEQTWVRTQHRVARSRLLVVSSRIEGGANVVSEALAAGVPVLASSVSGNVGLLGRKYPGYFQAGDTRELAALLQRAEMDAEFYKCLGQHCRARSALVSPERERRDWDDLLGEFLWEACGSRGSV